MASTLLLYRTEITPERNAWIENIQDYLDQKCQLTYEANGFQYQKIALNMSITIATSQTEVGEQTLGNYCVIAQDHRLYYYFITNAEWTSKNAVTLTISMDTINTYGEDLEFTDKTVIQRQHEDRFKPFYKEIEGGTDRLYFRKVDYEPENIVLPKVYTNNKVIRDTKGDFNWYLIYKTREDLTPENTANPIECDLIAETPLLLKKGTEERPPVYIYDKDIQGGKFYYFDNINNPLGKARDSSHPGRTWEFPPEDVGNFKSILVYWKKNESEALGRTLTYRRTNSDSWSLSSESDNFIIGLPLIFERAQSLGTSTGTTPNDIVNGYSEVIDLKPRFPINAGKLNDVSTIGINDIDKTNSRLMKIIRLPYCPVRVTVNETGEYKFPTEWEFKSGMMRLTTNKLSTELENYIGYDDLSEDMTIRMTPSATDLRDIKYESKLYNSEFYTLKYVYDSFTKEIKLENVNILGTATIRDTIKVPIYFKPTNTVNSKFAFNFKRKELNYNYVTDKDYDDFLIVDRNNEETIFSNDYLNYIRNGYNYDKKAKNMQLVQGLLGTALGLGQTGLTAYARTSAERGREESLKRLERKTPRSGIGASLLARSRDDLSPILTAGAIKAGFGAVNGLIGTIAGQVSAQDSINAKLQQLASQSSNVSGSDDVDLLQYYSGNRLEKKTYKIRGIANRNIYNLFHYTGYSHPVQSMPKTDTRYWFNYIQCIPTFKHEMTSKYNAYLTDIKARFEQGVTKFHYHAGVGEEWDIDQNYENWENWILN